ncbi:MAG: hypothetical protein IPK83_17200 [Planctomycetes bacterium]|nr:hypothetical protein [Planctomycetota bacterium]
MEGWSFLNASAGLATMGLGPTRTGSRWGGVLSPPNASTGHYTSSGRSRFRLVV